MSVSTWLREALAHSVPTYQVCSHHENGSGNRENTPQARAQPSACKNVPTVPTVPTTFKALRESGAEHPKPPGPAVLHFKLAPQPGTCPGGTLIDHGGDWAAALRVLIDRYGVRLNIEDLREQFEERAAIREFDGEQPRNEAEQAAWAECLEVIERAKQTSQGAKP